MYDIAPAPLDPAALAAVLEPEFGRARTLPAEAYLSDDVLAWERAAIFGRGWSCAGRTSELLPEPGAQRAIDLAGAGVLLARDMDGTVRAFHNTCRHRGHELLEPGGCRTRQSIGCPYHGWVFALDGSLRQASRFSNVPGFDPADFPLIDLGAVDWHGWLFVNPAADRTPFDEWTGNLTTLLGPWEPERLVAGARHEYVVRANWKLIVENYLECYHCPLIHPELCAVSPPESARAIEHEGGIWIGGPMELVDSASTMSLTGESGGVTLRGLDAEQRRHVHYFALMPNLLISAHPDYVMTHRMEALSPTATSVECSWLFAPEATGQPGFDPSYAERFWDITNRQDFAAVESVQRGLASPGFLPGPFDYREGGVLAWQAILAEAYRSGEVRPPRSVDMAAR